MVTMQFCAYVQNVSLLVVQYVFFYYKLFKKKRRLFKGHTGNTGTEKKSKIENCLPFNFMISF